MFVELVGSQGVGVGATLVVGDGVCTIGEPFTPRKIVQLVRSADELVRCLRSLEPPMFDTLILSDKQMQGREMDAVRWLWPWVRSLDLRALEFDEELLKLPPNNVRELRYLVERGGAGGDGRVLRHFAPHLRRLELCEGRYAPHLAGLACPRLEKMVLDAARNKSGNNMPQLVLRAAAALPALRFVAVFVGAPLARRLVPPTLRPDTAEALRELVRSPGAKILLAHNLAEDAVCSTEGILESASRVHALAPYYGGFRSSVVSAKRLHVERPPLAPTLFWGETRAYRSENYEEYVQKRVFSIHEQGVAARAALLALHGGSLRPRSAAGRFLARCGDHGVTRRILEMMLPAPHPNTCFTRAEYEARVRRVMAWFRQAMTVGGDDRLLMEFCWTHRVHFGPRQGTFPAVVVDEFEVP
jgi:hypothetical protein